MFLTKSEIDKKRELENCTCSARIDAKFNNYLITCWTLGPQSWIGKSHFRSSRCRADRNLKPKAFSDFYLPKQQQYAISFIPATIMPASAIKTASRAVLRRSQQFPWHAKRSHTNSAHPSTPRSTPSEDPSTATTIPVPNTVATLPLWQRLGPLSRAFEAYGRSQRKRPYLTQIYSSLGIYFLGDMSAQKISGEEYDPFRTLRALAIGAGSSIPSYKWFMFLGSHFNYPSKILSLSTKVVVNQIVFTPIFNSYFFGMQSLLSGDNLSEVWERIRRTVPVSFVNSCRLWPAVTAFSFTFIGAQYRSIFAGFIAIGWQTYLSYLNRQAEEAEFRERAQLRLVDKVEKDVLVEDHRPGKARRIPV